MPGSRVEKVLSSSIPLRTDGHIGQLENSGFGQVENTRGQVFLELLGPVEDYRQGLAQGSRTPHWRLTYELAGMENVLIGTGSQSDLFRWQKGSGHVR